MAKVATLTLTLNVVGDGVNEQDVIFQQIINPSPAFRTFQAVFAGNTTIGFPNFTPAQPSYVLVTPQAGLANNKLLKGNNGDAGITWQNQQTLLLPASQTQTLIVNATVSENLGLYFV